MFRLMLVEDSPSFRQLAEYKLQDQFPSMDIIEVVNGVEAFPKNRCSSTKSNLYGHSLLGENGIELTRKIKADYPNVTITILTSHDSPEYRGGDPKQGRLFVFQSAISNNGIFT